MSEQFGWACGRVLRWHEPSAALDDAPAYNLDIFDTELGLWLTLAHVDLEGDAMAQGIPVLRGPYIVDWGDIPHHGDTKVLWAPQVGDVLLRLFADWQTVVQWDSGALLIGQNVGFSPQRNTLTQATCGNIGGGIGGPGGALDMAGDAANDGQTDSAGGQIAISAYCFHTADPVEVRLQQIGGTDPTRGHVELYALVARAVAP